MELVKGLNYLNQIPQMAGIGSLLSILSVAVIVQGLVFHVVAVATQVRILVTAM